MKENMQFMQDFINLCDSYQDIKPILLLRRHNRPLKELPNILVEDVSALSIASFVLNGKLPVFIGDNNLWYKGSLNRPADIVKYVHYFEEDGLYQFKSATSGYKVQLREDELDTFLSEYIPNQKVMINSKLIDRPQQSNTTDILTFRSSKDNEVFRDGINKLFGQIIDAIAMGKNVNVSISSPKEKAKFIRFVEFL